MMSGTARRLLALGGAAAIIVTGLLAFRGEDSVGTPGAPAGQAPAAAAADVETPVADVKLELLKEPAAELPESERNPFRFEARRSSATPQPDAGGPSEPVTTLPPVPTGPPPPPPIPLRFIGLVDAPTQAGRVAILSDGRGNVFHGREGDIIEGRYRLLKVGSEAVELVYIDGRGRQTIRLSGQ